MKFISTLRSQATQGLECSSSLGGIFLDLQSMAKIMDPTLPLLSILGYWAIVLSSFGGPGCNS